MDQFSDTAAQILTDTFLKRVPFPVARCLDTRDDVRSVPALAVDAGIGRCGGPGFEINELHGDRGGANIHGNAVRFLYRSAVFLRSGTRSGFASVLHHHLIRLITALGQLNRDIFFGVSPARESPAFRELLRGKYHPILRRRIQMPFQQPHPALSAVPVSSADRSKIFTDLRKRFQNRLSRLHLRRAGALFVFYSHADRFRPSQRAVQPRTFAAVVLYAKDLGILCEQEDDSLALHRVEHISC